MASFGTFLPDGVVRGDKLGDYFVRNGKLRKAHGLSWVLGAFFIVADMAGGGIVALPTAVVRCDYYAGIVMLTAMALVATFSAILLGKCWEILLRRFPVYRTHCRKPYAEIGFRALGAKMRTLVSVCVNIGAFGASTVFLLLCAKNIQDFVLAFLGLRISYCILIVVIALLLLPVTLLKSPNDFWVAVVGGMLSTGLAICLICAGTLRDVDTCAPHRELPPFTWGNCLYALGTMLFAYGGHNAFPTIQHDMKKPYEFNKSAILGFFIMSVFNITTVTLCGYVYGNSLRDSVINSLQTVWIQQAVNVMITAHCLLTITLIVNPLNQEVEEFFNVPQGFGWKRIASRTLVLSAIVFVGLSVPSFGPVLDFVGGSIVALTSVIFPLLFFLYLSAAERAPDCEQPISFAEMVQRTDRKTLVVCGTIIGLSACVGLIATASALKGLTSTHFVAPCYLQNLLPGAGTAPNASAPAHKLLSSTNCCGPAQNISRYGTTAGHCSRPDLHFY